MSLTININLPDVDAGGSNGVSRDALDRHMAALGFERQVITLHVKDVSGTMTPAEVRAAEDLADDAPNTRPTPTAAARERGKPAPGRARRTREEIAEDEAADKADAASGTTQSISTGGERINPEDDAETQAQDRADEEAEEGKTEEPAITMEQAVMAGKAAIGDYVKKFGMAAAQEDGMSVFIGALGDVPAGAKGWGWSMLAESGNLAGAIKAAKAWQAAAAAAGRFGA